MTSLDDLRARILSLTRVYTREAHAAGRPADDPAAFLTVSETMPGVDALRPEALFPGVYPGLIAVMRRRMLQAVHHALEVPR